MDLAPLLLLLPFKLGAFSENCKPNNGFGVNQPQLLEAPEGGSVRIPFSFYHTWELAESPAVNIIWRWQNFHGDTIYDQTRNQTHKEFKDRLFLEWTESQAQGVLVIQKLRRGDATTYFCRVQLNTKRCGTQSFQSMSGTKLTVTPAPSLYCNSDPVSRVDQPEHLVAPEGGSIRINFTLHMPGFYFLEYYWSLVHLNITWRWKDLQGDIIHDQTLNLTHEEFRDRLFLDWIEGQTHGALLIWNLRRADATMYFCQVRWMSLSCGIQEMKSVSGTKLTVTTAQSKDGLDVTDSTQSAGSLGQDAVVAVTVTIALLKVTILGLVSYLVWKRRQG